MSEGCSSSLPRRCGAGFNPDPDLNNNSQNSESNDEDPNTGQPKSKASVAGVNATVHDDPVTVDVQSPQLPPPDKFAVPDFENQVKLPKEEIAGKISTSEKQEFGDGFTISESEDKFPRSGSMFVRISDTSVDRERMAEFEKLEKDNNGNTRQENVGKKESQVQVINTNKGNEHDEKSEKNNNQAVPSMPPRNTSIKMHDTVVKPSSINSKPSKPGIVKSGTEGLPKNKDPSANPIKPAKSPGPKVPPRPRHVLTVELGRKIAPLRDKSPYACKIIQLPPDHSGERQGAKKKVWVCPKDHKLLEDHFQEPKEKKKIVDTGRNWLPASHPPPLFQEKHATVGPPSFDSYSTTESIPLTQWPNFQSSQKSFAKFKAVSGSSTDQLFGINLHSDLTSLTSSYPKTYPHNFSSILAFPIGTDGGGTSNVHGDGETNSNANEYSFALNEMAELVERGIFTAGETCNVLINTVFKESLRNPNSLERVMESKEFHSFLQSSNEVAAIERCSEIMTTCSQVIEEYLDAINTSGVTIPPDTNFAQRSDGVVCVTTARKNFTLAEAKKKYLSESRVWSFVPPTTLEKFQLALFLNQETGEIMQTISCQDHIFRIRYSVSPIESQIRHIISASREQVGLPAFVKPESLLDSIVRCSSFVLTRLTKAKTLLSRSNQKLAEFLQKLTKTKYIVSVSKVNNLDYLRKKLQQLNVCTGIIYQMSVEMTSACDKIQAGLWNSMHIMDLPGRIHPNTKDGQVQEKMSAQESMLNLSSGIRSIDSAIRLGAFSLETVGLGVKLKKGHKKLLKDYLDGIRTLGSEKDVDYGSLLMTILCSTEMMNHFENVIPSLDKSVKGSILFDLLKMKNGMADLIKIVDRMGTDSRILAMRTTFKLRELKNRFKEECGVNT